MFDDKCVYFNSVLVCMHGSSFILRMKHTDAPKTHFSEKGRPKTPLLL